MAEDETEPPISLEGLFETQEAGASLVDGLTGVRAQFEAAGWSRESAEAIVLSSLQSGVLTQQQALVDAQIRLALIAAGRA